MYKSKRQKHMYSSPIFCIEEGNKGYGFFRTDLNAVSLFYLFLITVDLPDCVSFRCKVK